MADGFAQATRRPALVNLHTAAGIGNGTCNYNIMTALLNKTPLIMAGQQTREMIICDPLLTNRDETMLLRPRLKWAYQPTRPQDVPGTSWVPTPWRRSHRQVRCSSRSRRTTGTDLLWAAPSSARSAPASHPSAEFILVACLREFRACGSRALLQTGRRPWLFPSMPRPGSACRYWTFCNDRNSMSMSPLGA